MTMTFDEDLLEEEIEEYDQPLSEGEIIREAQRRKTEDDKMRRERDRLIKQQAISEWQESHPGESFRNNPEAGDWIVARVEELKRDARNAKGLFSGNGAAVDAPAEYDGDFEVTLNMLVDIRTRLGAEYDILHINGPGDDGVMQLVIGAKR